MGIGFFRTKKIRSSGYRTNLKLSENLKTSGRIVRLIAEIIDPVIEPSPPTTVQSRISIDFRKVKDEG